MELTLQRVYMGDQYTIGKLRDEEGSVLCDTLEPTDRHLYHHTHRTQIAAVKQLGSTAIPTGNYSLTLSVVSPRFASNNAYAFCQGRLPRLLNVPGYEGVLIHIGNYPEDTQGCILVGRNLVKGQLLRSAATFRCLYEHLEQARQAGEALTLRITRLGEDLG